MSFRIIDFRKNGAIYLELWKKNQGETLGKIIFRRNGWQATVKPHFEHYAIFFSLEYLKCVGEGQRMK